MADLRESAMLVHQRTRQWTGTKNDPRIRDAAAAKHGVKAGAVRGGQKVLLGSENERLVPIQGEYREASRIHLARTLSWLDSGPRILTAAGYADYMAIMRGHQTRIAAAAGPFCDWYGDQWRMGMPTSRADLNGLFDFGDYPDPARMARRFKFEIDTLPVPAAEDFRVDLGVQELERIRQGITASVQDAIGAAQGEVFERIRNHVGHMVDRLRAYDPDGEKVVGKFHDTLVSNVRELVALLPALDVVGDGKLSELETMMAACLRPLPAAGSVAGKDDGAAALRENERLRLDVAAAADAVLTRMADFV